MKEIVKDLQQCIFSGLELTQLSRPMSEKNRDMSFMRPYKYYTEHEPNQYISHMGKILDIITGITRLPGAVPQPLFYF